MSCQLYSLSARHREPISHPIVGHAKRAVKCLPFLCDSVDICFCHMRHNIRFSSRNFCGQQVLQGIIMTWVGTKELTTWSRCGLIVLKKWADLALDWRLSSVKWALHLVIDPPSEVDRVESRVPTIKDESGIRTGLDRVLVAFHSWATKIITPSSMAKGDQSQVLSHGYATTPMDQRYVYKETSLMWRRYQPHPHITNRNPNYPLCYYHAAQEGENKNHLPL